MRGLLRRCEPIRHPLVVTIIAAGIASGCSSSASRLDGVPLFAASNATQSTSDVSQAPLPPLGSPSGGSAGPSPAIADSLRARGWSVDNAPIVEVTSADTAVTLSQGYGVPVGVILEANGLQRADEIRAGQRLVIPTYVREDTPFTAPLVSDQPTPIANGPGEPPTTLNEKAGLSPSTAPGGLATHVVAEGETLWSISQRYGVRPHELIEANDLSPTGTVRFGQTLTIPGEGDQTTLADTAPQTKTDVAANSGRETETQVAMATAETTPAQVSEPSAAATSAPMVEEPATKATASDAASGFRWPVRGRLIAGFGKQADGARNDGINLAVPAGTPVRAAEDGTVIYAGNELEGYGNLVLVQHQDDWVSAYAHNAELKVARGDKVSRGQAIAAVGATGSVDSPQLHFELRKRSKPVDPLPHLADG